MGAGKELSEKLKEELKKKWGVSALPMVLGILGGVLSLPGALKSCLCAGLAVSVGAVSVSYLVIPLICSICSIIFGCVSLYRPSAAAYALIISGLLNLVVSLSLPGPALTLAAGGLCFLIDRRSRRRGEGE